MFSKFSMVALLSAVGQLSFQGQAFAKEIVYASSTIPHIESLELYCTSYCPYCKKVFSFMDQENLSFPKVFIDKDKEGRMNLVQVGGKAQVPCLVINKKLALYESNDIISWLKTNQKQVAEKYLAN